MSSSLYILLRSNPSLVKFSLSQSYCPRLTKLGRGLWNGLRTSVRPSGLKINQKCYFSVISWPILILFVLSDRAWCRLNKTKFYTEFWNSLIMQIYNKPRGSWFQRDSRTDEKCYFSVISLIMQIYANLFKINKKCYLTNWIWTPLCHFLADFDSVCFIW